MTPRAIRTRRYIREHNPRAAEMLHARAQVRLICSLPRVFPCEWPWGRVGEGVSSLLHHLRPHPVSLAHAAARHRADSITLLAIAFCWVPFSGSLTLYAGLDCWLNSREQLGRNTGLLPTLLSLALIAAWFVLIVR